MKADGVARYQAGDAVQINIRPLQGEPGARFRASDTDIPSEPAEWTEALIERVASVAEGRGGERYRILITSGPLAGRHGSVEARLLRARPQRA